MLTPIKNSSKLEQLIRALICVEGLYYTNDINQENPVLDKIYEITHGVLGCGASPKTNCPIVRDLFKNIESVENLVITANIMKLESIQMVVDKIKQEVYDNLQNTTYGT